MIRMRTGLRVKQKMSHDFCDDTRTCPVQIVVGIALIVCAIIGAILNVIDIQDRT